MLVLVAQYLYCLYSQLLPFNQNEKLTPLHKILSFGITDMDTVMKQRLTIYLSVLDL